jgi:hypothetical protein
MRKLIVWIPAAAVIAAAGVAVLQVGPAADAGTAGAPASRAAASARPAGSPDRLLTFTTKMLAFKAIDLPPAGLSPGDEYLILGNVIRLGKPDGHSTAQCTFTVTSGPVLRICTVDYALRNGLIVTDGYIKGSTPGAAVTLVVAGGTGAYQNVRGYGKLQPTKTGSDVTLHLTG